MPVAPDRRSDLAREPESAALGRFLRIVGGAPVSSEQVVAQDQAGETGKRWRRKAGRIEDQTP